MNPRTRILTCTLAGLALAPLPALVQADPPPAAPSPVAAVADTPAVAVVRQFLAARMAGHDDAMYTLLSPLSQESLTKGVFLDGGVPAAANLSAAPLAVMALFFTHSTPDYAFAVIGPGPVNPHVVLVRASRPAHPDIVLRLLTVTDSSASKPRLDFIGSLIQANPQEAMQIFRQEREDAKRAASQSNLKQLALGVIQYEQDHDEHAPDADKWVDEIMPYVKSEPLFHDPSAPAGEKWSYAYNRALSGKSLAQFDAPAQTVMLFESTKGVKNASDTGQSVPHPGRHLGGTDYALADGHVKWYPDGTKLSYRLDGK